MSTTTQGVSALDQRWDEDRKARAALTWLVDAASTRLAAMLQATSPAELWANIGRVDVDSWRQRASRFDLDRLVTHAGRLGIRFIVPGDDEWPDQLSDLDHIEQARLGGRPLGLWLRGPVNLAQSCQHALAIVGSRSCSTYGERVAHSLGHDLARGVDGPVWTILSGGAFGIDAWAHRGALDADGRTIAVLANGLDAPYPRGNALLFDRLMAEHLLVSEVPPGAHATKVGFLARNRLLAALSSGTIVVEAAGRSGARNTAGWAGELNRVVMAVPGPVFSEQSVTPHRLVRDGEATLVTGAKDVQALMAPMGQAPELPLGGPARVLDDLSPTMLTIREALPGRGGMDAGTICERTGLRAPTVMAGLARLEQRGLVTMDDLGLWHLARPTVSSAEQEHAHEDLRSSGMALGPAAGS